MDGALGHHATRPPERGPSWPPCHPARQNEGALATVSPRPPERGASWPLCHPARQNEGPSWPPCHPRPPERGALWPASWPSALGNGVSRKREDNAHFSPFEETTLPRPRKRGRWTKSGQKEG